VVIPFKREMKKRLMEILLFFILIVLCADIVFAACGTLNGDYTLISNETTAGDCFVIGADEITLDCAGHSIIGGGTGTGIAVNSKNNVVIKNCNIDGFATGVNITDSSLITVNNTNVSNSVNGIFIDPSAGTKVKNGKFESCTISLNLDNSQDGILEDLTISDSGTGILIGADSANNQISEIRFSSISGDEIVNLGTGTMLTDVACSDHPDCNPEGTPFYNDFAGNGITTDFSGEGDLTSVSSATISDGSNQIVWQNFISVVNANFNDNINMGDGFVSVNTEELDASMNSEAQITLKGIDCENYVIYSGTGFVSSASETINQKTICSDCTIDSCSSGTLTFSVLHFTSYASGPSTNLTIFDDTDTQVKNVNQQIDFFANYSNSTDSSPITGASCNISFQIAPNGPFAMSYNAASKFYEYNRSFSSPGTTNWNVTCAATGFAILNATDTVVVSSSGGAVPEFSTYAMLLALVLVAGGFLAYRNYYS